MKATHSLETVEVCVCVLHVCLRTECLAPVSLSYVCQQRHGFLNKLFICTDALKL